MVDLKNLVKALPSLATNELQKLLSSVQSELDSRSKQDSVELITNFCSDDITVQAIWAECDSLNFGNNKRKASSQWLSSDNEPYVYSDTNPVHEAKNITNFPGICKLMGMINADARFSGPVDSCLILKYSCESTSSSLHADDEAGIDQKKSICNYSIGTTRTLEFFDKQDTKTAVKSVVMENNSMTHMKPGTQQLLKHMVRGSTAKAPGVRYSISFRGLNKTHGNISAENVKPAPTMKSEPITTRRRRVCLVAGDSYAARLDEERLGRRGMVNVVKIAEGGSKLDKVAKQLEDYAEANKDVIVDKICISVGTNDIRNCHHGVNHLRGPLKQFCKNIKGLYPDSSVYFQTLLPLPCKGSNDWQTNHKVIRFNKILFDECVFNRFYVIDAFRSFILPRWSWSRGSPHIRNEKCFDENDIHPSVKFGMGVLAKLYLRVLHSKYFSPYVYQ